MLEVEKITFSYNKKTIIEDISLNVNKGDFVGIIGPNGSGKSTVLKNIYRALTPERGKILLDGEDLIKMSYKSSAKKMAVVNQENELHFDFEVEEIVSMGRSPHKKLFEIDNEDDKKIVKSALEVVGLDGFSKRSFQKLSGGEKQRVLIARALAQEARLLILDEPTNHLDINYQIQVLELIKNLDVTVLAALHDLNLAALFCTRLIVIKAGRVIIEGTPEEVLTYENILEIYGVKTVIEKNKLTNKINISYLPNSVVKEELGINFKE